MPMPPDNLATQIPPGLSVLEYLLEDWATVPPERGVFLATTWRMHENVCRFISDAVYARRWFWLWGFGCRRLSKTPPVTHREAFSFIRHGVARKTPRSGGTVAQSFSRYSSTDDPDSPGCTP